MTLTEIRAVFPELFYGQNWFIGEAFMQREPVPLTNHLWTSTVPPSHQHRVHAVDLAARYVKEPHLSIWKKFLWTDDSDSYGNRIYVAGVGQYGCQGFQIHRKLEPEAYWVMTV